jgi:hypothetical protein
VHIQTIGRFLYVYVRLIGRYLKMQKNLIRLRAFEDKSSHPNSKKFCVTCGAEATREALFDAGDGAILVEKYCDMCAKNVN